MEVAGSVVVTDIFNHGANKFHVVGNQSPFHVPPQDVTEYPAEIALNTTDTQGAGLTADPGAMLLPFLRISTPHSSQRLGLNIPCRYYEALCHHQLGENLKATKIYDSIANMGIDFFITMYQPAIQYYRAMACKGLGEENKGNVLLSECIKKWEGEKEKRDYGYFKAARLFISYLEDPGHVRSRHFCYLLGLAHKGLENRKKAAGYFSKVLESNCNDLWAALEFELLVK